MDSSPGGVPAEAGLDAQDEHGCTALIRSAQDGEANVVRRLISAGAALGVQDREGKTALWYATKRGGTHGHADVANILREAEAAIGVTSAQARMGAGRGEMGAVGGGGRGARSGEGGGSRFDAAPPGMIAARAKGTALSFDAARAFVRTLKLGSQKEWQEYSSSSKRPSNISSDPAKMYRDAGWVSMPDWLGYKAKTVTTMGTALSFEAARDIVRTLKLGGSNEWEKYCSSGKRPSNIPSHPERTYLDAGWVSWSDWLGYKGKNVMKKGGALPFDAARAFVRSLKLGNMEEWKGYSSSGKRPSNIPSHPDRTYRNAGWVSMPDWLGCEGRSGEKITSKMLPFDAARAFVRALKLGSTKEWHEYSKSGKRPANIPSQPDAVYRDTGWVSIPDWLGYESRNVMAKGTALSFEAARAFVRTLKLGGWKEWQKYSRSGKRPSNIPSCPQGVYRDTGWVSVPDWLGYERKNKGQKKGKKKRRKYQSDEEDGEGDQEDDDEQGGAQDMEEGYEAEAGKGSDGAPPPPWLSFEAARIVIWTMKLGSVGAWNKYRKGGECPANIPGNPDEVYRDAGWVSLADWIGCGNLSFEAARAFVRSLKLGSWREWQEYSKSDACPSNIPHSPSFVYRNTGWVSNPDWMGYEGMVREAQRGANMLSFLAARTFARTLKLGSSREWYEYSKSGKRPSNIPSSQVRCTF